MGFDVNTTRFLLSVKRLGVDFSKSATIGRQDLLLTKRELKKNFTDFQVEVDERTVSSMFDGNRPYAEGFLRALGAEEVESFDYSSYEGATNIHDMNFPAPDNFKERYSLVIDGGSLEHVFNYPTAIKNCLEFVRPGGHFIAINPANNYLGHGFYQFSPELYFRVLVPDNGFEIRQVLLAEDRQNSKWWVVKDPAAIRCRGTLVNEYPTLIFVLAKKVASAVPLRITPQQSDYFAVWTSNEKEAGLQRVSRPAASGGLESLRRAARLVIPRFVRRLLVSPYKQKFFEEIDLRRALVK